ncbi:dTMP kinase [Plantactinospora sp. GCM10030261]|uniref:dTMP kinase n=1 Tax=Plantactinospora sp. GCM10030261 TaxID=3273420 RepID=UPI003612364A
MLSVAAFGDWLGLLATSIFASSQVEGSAAKGAAFGGVIAVRLLPALVLGPVAGILADRFDRRYTMVICDVLRFVLFASIPLVALSGVSGAVVVGWAAIATFLIEAVTLLWIPAKEAAVPNLVPRARLETANQLSLITTYGLTPVLAAISLSVLTVGIPRVTGDAPPAWAEPAQLALYFNAFSRLATALVVFFGIKEISGRSGARERSEASVLRQFVEGWRFISKTPLVRGLVLGIFGAFAGGGMVIGTANFFTRSLNAGPAAFSLLFGALFVGLAIGIGLGPTVVRDLSRRRWFGMSIVLASASVLALAAAIHLSMAILGAILVGAGAGMAFLAGMTLLGGEIADDVRGRVFAVVQTGTRIVLMLAIALSSFLAGLGGSRELRVADLGISVSSTRLLLLAAGIAGILAGISSFRQMDDKPGVPVLADLWGSIRGRPLSPTEPFAAKGVFLVFEGGEGAGKSTQVNVLAERLREQGREVVITREPGATDVGEQIRGLVLGRQAGMPLAPRTEALLYAADRAQHVAAVVRPALARGAVVISDRYVDSSLAYQGAGRTLPVDEVSWLSSWATGGLKPDLVVVLDVEPAVGLERVAGRGGDIDRLESESLAFHERVRLAFLDLAAADPRRYLVLDASRPADEVTEAVVAQVTERFTNPDTIVHPDPARPPDTSVEPKLSDAEFFADMPPPGSDRTGSPARQPTPVRSAPAARRGEPPAKTRDGAPPAETRDGEPAARTRESQPVARTRGGEPDPPSGSFR